MPKFGFDATDVGMNWVFVWFSIGFGYQIFWDVWPFSSMKQPLGGAIAGVVSIVISALVWKLLLNWFEAQEAYAYLSYTQFFVFTYGWFWHNWPFDKMGQPWKGLLFTAITIVFGLFTYQMIGPIAESYIFYLPLWLFYFFYDSPITSQTPLRKGFFWTAIILVFSYLLYACQIVMGFPFATAKGQDVFALAFIFLLLCYALEGWPFSKLPQPFHGFGVCAGTLLMTAAFYPVFYGVFQAPEWSLVTWSYTAWVFFAILAWYTPPWLVTDEAVEHDDVVADKQEIVIVNPIRAANSR
ncbi:MAG: hypothetical protein GY874_10755 [Desulfobacteraceae bacterium]|nr:hypothetical protein [Desulfobacteraceae bacterium]